MSTKEYNLTTVDFDPFEGKEIEKIAITNEPQREIWLSCIFGGKEANLSYNESVSLKFEGSFIFSAFDQAVRDLIIRHEALRSVISTNGETLIIYKDFPIDIYFEDISAKNEPEQKNILEQFLKKEMNSPFDLQEGPLCRFSLHKLSESGCFFTLTIHHIVGDGWSIAIILQDISKLYTAYAKGETACLPKAPQISEYAIQQQVYMQSPEYLETEKFWIDQYKENVPVLDIPTDQPRPIPRTYKSQRDDYPLENDLITAVKKMGAKAGCSLVTTLLASFEVLLHRLTGQEDIVIGLPAAGQSAADNYGLVGHCVNLLPVQSNPTGEMTFMDYLKSRKKGILDAYDHQQFTFGSLLKKLNIKRDPSRIAIVPLLFNIDMGLADGVDFYGLKYELLSNPREFENFEIFLNATGTEHSLILEWSYNTQLFKPSTIREMMNKFKFLLHEVIKDPSQKIKDVLLTNALSFHDKLSQWNNTFLEYPKEKALPSLISAKALQFSDKIALQFSDRQLTYKQLNERANQLAALLLANGIQTGDTIGLALDRSVEMVISLLAILKSGAAYVPLDPEYPRERIEFMLTDSSAKILLTSKKYRHFFQSDAKEILIEDALEKLSDYPKRDPVVQINSSDLAYVLYTSGSTGKPKGVMVEHRNLINLLNSMQKMPGISVDDKLLAVTTISFDIAGLELYLPLITGAKLVLADSQTNKDGFALLDVIKKENISIIQATPSTYKMMLDAGWDEKIAIKILCGGEPLSKDLAAKLIPKGSALYNMYGPTETTIWSTCTQIFPDDKTIAIGQPIHNTEIYILDENLNLLPEDSVGEIYIAGDGLARGYLNRPELTREKFVPNPFSKQAGSKMYRTGDLGKFLPDGKIQCLGRIDHQVKIRGHRIELGEIEHSLNQQRGIKEAIVIAREDRPGDQRLVAYIVPDNEASESDGLGWRDRWDDLYEMAVQNESDLDISEQKLDLAIGTQYNTELNIREQLEEWGLEGAKRIKAIKAKRIMELGCGGGQILFEVAPYADHYIATDYSEVAISKVNEKKLAKPEKWANVTANVAPADDFSGIENNSLDLVFAHGVVQYFPDLPYLIKVIQNAIKVIKQEGIIYIGDMQTLNALKMHYAYDQLNLVSDSVSIAEFKKIIDRRIEKEEELTTDPAFFYFLPTIIPQIVAVDVQLRRGTFFNEGTKCHYDIWLYIGSGPSIVTPEITSEWDSDSSISWIEEMLIKHPSRILQINNIPNKRIAKDYTLLQLMNGSDSNVKVSKLKQKIEDIQEGVDPELLWELGARLGYKAHVRWPKDGETKTVEVVYIPLSYTNAIPQKPISININNARLSDFEIKSTIGNFDISDDQIKSWKAAIKKLLPAYMLPADYVFLPRLPLTANGKIDRNSLPKPEQQQKDNQYIAPRTEIEKFLAAAWIELLGVEQIGVNEDFLELGGHSLIAIKVIFKIKKATGIRLPIAIFFENSTVEKLAQVIVKRQTPDNLADANDINQVVEKSEPEQEPEEIWLPALESQIELWLTYKFGGEDVNRSYNLSFSQKLNGNFDRVAMEKALQSIVDRHESLRITFSEDGTQMCIHKSHSLEIPYKDISALQPAEQTLFIDQLAVQNAETPFNLLTGPLFKISLVKLSDNQHYLTITAHHIICDGLSIGIIMEELGILYSAYAKGEHPKLPKAPKFSDYATKNLAFYNSKEYHNIGKYWLDKFKNDVPVMDIPTDFSRPATRTFASKQIDHKVNPELFAKFIQVGSKAGSSAVISIRTILEILLYRLTGRPDILIGLPIAGQFADAEIERLVGNCPNMLPLISHIDGHDSYLNYLRQRKSAILEAFEYQQIEIGNLLRQLNISRDNSRIPFLPVASNIDLNQDNPISFYGLNSQLIFHHRAYDFFELTLNISGSIKSPVLNWAYNSDLFKRETIQKLIADFEHLLTEIARNPEIKIKDISVSDSSLFTKLKKWNNTEAEYPKDKSLVALIHETALQHPGQIAIEFYEQKISYKDLDEKSNQFAALLIQQGIITGQTIGLAVDRSPQMIIALLAIMKSGAAYIPLDPEYPRERIEYMLEDSNAKILITSKKYSRHFKTSGREIILEDSLSKLSQFSKELPLTNVNGSDLIYILYTSGSTGKPKGVQIEHHNLVNFLLSMQKQPGITASDSLLAITTISFDPSGLEFYLPLITGAKIILADTETARDGYKLLELIKEKKVTLVQATPPTWRMLLDSGWNKAYGFKALCGGEALPKDMAAKLLSLCSSLWNVYGPTETTVWSIIKQIISVEEPITIGRPIDNMQAYILDEYFNHVPIGVTGEIFIAGEGLGRGYCNKADLTAERFIPNPFEKDNNKKMYRTGDIGKFLENGEIECLGRSDNQVKIRGHRIELGEIENNIIKLEHIKNVVVLAREDNPGDQRLVAYVICSSFTNNKEQDDIAVNEKKVKWNETLKKVLPAYMIPNDWVILTKFPLSPNNKIDRKALPKPVLQINGYSKKNRRFPTTSNQKIIAKIWEDELRCQAVSLDDDFFELGGHSLIAVRMMTRLEKETGKRIPLTALFESPTVEKLASAIELDKKDIKWNSLVPIKTYGNKTPIYLIHGDGLSVLLFNSLAKNLHPEQPLYGLQAKGLDGIHEDLDRMESIALHYIEEILQQNPEGPYALGGYSFGGLIAFEMAKQLKAMGKKVTLLALFDSYADESIYHKPLLTKIALNIYDIFMRVVFAFAFMTKEPKIVITNKIRFAKILLKPILEKASLKKEADPESFVAYSKKSSKMYQIAYRNYKLTPYDGSVDLFRAKKQTAYLPDFKYMGWKPFALKGVNIHDVPGNHLAIFRSPNVEELAKVLQDSLDKAAAKTNEND